jgi:hypothetical protein
MDYVVRGGTATADLLQNGYLRHKGVPNVFGFSVQYFPGKTLQELSAAGGFLNHQISYATPDELLQSVQLLGYTIQLINSPGKGYHHTVCVLYDTSNAMLQMLPRDAAEAMSAAFHRMPNPAIQL